MRVFFSSIFAAVVVFWVNCGQQSAGTASETDTYCRIEGVVYTGDSLPVANADIRLHLQGSPLKQVVAKQRTLADAITTTETDADGKFNIDSVRTGTYVVEINDRDVNGGIIPFVVTPEDRLVTMEGHVSSLGRIKGTVDSISLADAAEKGHVISVVIEELDRSVPIDSAGGFIFNSLPPWEYHVVLVADDSTVASNKDSVVVSVESGETVVVVCSGDKTVKESVSDSIAQFKADSIAQFKADSIAQFKADSIAQFKADSIAQFKADSIAQFKADSIAQFKADSIAQFKADSIAQFKADSIAQFKADSIAQFKADSIAQFKADSIEQFKADSIEQFKADSIEQFKADSIEQFKADSIEQFKADSIAAIRASLNAELLAYYPLDGNAEDASGNGFDGIVTNAVPAVDRNGASQGAYYFDGNSGIGAAVDSRLSLTTFTLSVWLKSTGMGTFMPRLIAVGSSSTQDNYYGMLYAYGEFKNVPEESKRLVFMNGQLSFTDYEVYFSNGSVDTAEWHHAVITCNNQQIRIYIDGVPDKDTVITTPVKQFTGTAMLTMGYSPNGTDRFVGALDDVRIYGRVLSDEDVKALFELR